ncbi:MAG TPA: hypothetical protein P5235_10850 [Saprospiraceae bacterium]|nr:hypothetical protein [Lewinellaceae bacterium]HRX29876.1 hypothetical protein [Saprospiraceae bacterium]
MEKSIEFDIQQGLTITLESLGMVNNEEFDLQEYKRAVARQNFIQNHFEEYRRLYLNDDNSARMGSIIACDNGGFEDDFLYY